MVGDRNIDVIVLDFGSQYNQLIVRRIRELGVYAELFRFDVPIEEIISYKPKAIILSGGPASLLDSKPYIISEKIFSLGVPVLGICYGMQYIVYVFSGRLKKANKREYGNTIIEVVSSDRLFDGLPKRQVVWMSHEDIVDKVPKGFITTSITENNVISSIAYPEKKIYALQFHPEVSHTEYGKKIIENFIYKVAGISPSWGMDRYLEYEVEDIREKVGKEKVILAVSGGVDSTVLSVLLYKALGDRVIPVFVNNGLLRKNEEKEVIKNFDNLGIPIKYIDASDIFLDRLVGVISPEEKRKIIGRTFIEVFENVAREEKVSFLAQGTLYPDVIESGKVGPSDTIKTHHNVGGLPDKMNLSLIEPLKYLFKDEVRELGKKLGIPKEVLYRHPFPGPGLAVRILGEITREKLDILREADEIYISALKREGLYEKVWQAFAVLLPVKSVGVMGDRRSYGNVIALRAVISDDAMTADWAKLPYEFLGKVAGEIIAKVKEITRVVYDITSKPPGTIEWE
jgi:GMP synthase (glutamine-hydrolysing)